MALVATTSSALQALANATQPSVSGPTPKKSFNQIMQELSGAGGKRTDLWSNSLHKELVNFQQMVQSGKHLSPQQLLVYQIKAGQFGIRVELISKVAESVNATTRRFQSGA